MQLRIFVLSILSLITMRLPAQVNEIGNIKISFKPNQMPMPELSIPINAIKSVNYANPQSYRLCNSCNSCPEGFICQLGFCVPLRGALLGFANGGHCPDIAVNIDGRCYMKPLSARPSENTSVIVYFKDETMPMPKISIPLWPIEHVWRDRPSPLLSNNCDSCKVCPKFYTCQLGFCVKSDDYKWVSRGACAPDGKCPAGCTCIDGLCYDLSPNWDKHIFYTLPSGAKMVCSPISPCPAGYYCMNFLGINYCVLSMPDK